jgi:hypothetical protein
MQLEAPTYKIHRRDGHTVRQAFSVVAIYNDFYAGFRAQEALQWLKLTLGNEMDVSGCSLSFQALERLDVRSMAIHRAASADVIIIAISDGDPVPNHIERWMDSSLQQQHDGRAVLVALHDDVQSSSEETTPLCAYLARQAARWQTEFICNHEFDQRLDREFAMQCLRRKEPAITRQGQKAEKHSYRDSYRWGINE